MIHRLRWRLARRLLGYPFVRLPDGEGVVIVTYGKGVTMTTPAKTFTMTFEHVPPRFGGVASSEPYVYRPSTRTGTFKGTI